MSPRDPYRDEPRPASRRRGGCGCGCLVSLLVLLALAVAVLVGAEFAARHFAAREIEDRATTTLGAPAHADFGSDPVLLAALDKKLRTLHLTTDAAGDNPALDLTAHDITLEQAVWGGPLGRVPTDGVPRLGTVEGTATVTDAQLTAAAARGSSGDSGPLGALTRIESVRSDPAAGILRVHLAAGIDAGVRPGVDGQDLTFEPVDAQIAGMPVPGVLVEALGKAVTATLGHLPEGMSATGATAVPGGLRVDLAGRGVLLQK